MKDGLPSIVYPAQRRGLSLNSLPEHVQKGLHVAAERFAYKICVDGGLIKNGQSITSNGDAEFISRTLTLMWPEILLQRFAKITFREYVPVLGAPIYSKNVAFNILNMTGEAVEKSSYANDVDMVDVAMTEEMFNIYEIALGITMSFIETQASNSLSNPALGNAATNVWRGKMMALAFGNETKLQKMFLLGNDQVSGILNSSAVPNNTLSTSWATATIAQKLEDFMSSFTTVVAQSKGVFSPTVMGISLSAWTSILGRPRSEYSDLTLPEWFARNCPGLQKIVPDAWLDGAGTDDSNVMFFMDQGELNSNMVVSANLIGLPVEQAGKFSKYQFITRSTGWNLLQSQSVFRTDGL
jgi:hypothetical protein